jgi:hypothetical protein
VDATAGEQPHQLAELVHGEVRSADVHAHQAPSTWSDHIYGYLPVPAGVAVTSVRPDPTSLGPWTGFGVFCLYVAALLALAVWRLRRSDA